jgi:CheY-like chemotaxis protein
VNLLLIDDEPGIRDGLAAFLRLKGHSVRTAESLAAARRLLAAEAFDLIVADWHLGDGTAGDLLSASPLPAVVVSGFVGEIEPLPRWRVLEKPVAPEQLLQCLALAAPAATAEPRPPDPVQGLPADAADFLRLALHLAGDPGDAGVADDGEFVTLTATLVDQDEARLERLLALGGDQRVLERNGRAVLELRIHRDGRPDGASASAWDEPWPPAPNLVALDLGRGAPCTPQAFTALLGRVRAATGVGRDVRLLNVPSWLRLWAEISGMADGMPKRAPVGPRLPNLIAQLWR